MLELNFKNHYGDKVIPNKYIPILVQDNPEIDKNYTGKININPKDLDKIKHWILQNRQAIEDFWYGKILTDKELKEKLTKLDL